VSDAARVAERFMYLKKGKIAVDGDMRLLKETNDPELRRFINELFVAEQCI
jgi:ABC-type transporter Mla maintaining outer membrane lipid asymmetry ATPase subunit MlaF